MDASGMHELLRGYLNELDWSGGVSRDDIVGHLAGRDEALRTMVNEYVPEGTYQTAEAVVTLIPKQAWEDVQGDAWRGPASLDPEDVPSHFKEGPAGQDS